MATNLKSLSILFISLAFLFSACNEDNILCTNNRPITSQEHLVDISPLDQFPKILDILKKYPNLQVRRLISDEIATIIHCNVFYKKLKVFDENYLLVQGTRFPSFSEQGHASFDTIPISLIPKLNVNDAIRIAKHTPEFERGCTQSTLGIYDKNIRISGSTPEFKLCWQIQPDSDFHRVIIDANDGTVYEHN